MIDRKSKGLTFIAVNILLLVFVVRITILQQNMETPGLTPYVVLQLFAVTGMFLIVLTQKQVPLQFVLYDKPLKLGIFLYFLSMLSSIWSLMPAMSFAFAFQMFAFLLIFYYLMGNHDDFYSTEKYLIQLLMIFLLFALLRRNFIRGQFPSLAYLLNLHDLHVGGIGAALFSYCLAERTVCQATLNPRRARMLTFVAIFAFLSVLVGTSSGANVSLFVAFCALVIVRRNKLLTLLLIVIILVLILYPVIINDVISVVFPGKTQRRILNVGSRTMLWQEIWLYFRQKPILGWGFATIERLGSVYASDSHNSFLGILSGLGLVGTCLFSMFIFYMLLGMYRRRHLVGYTGLLCATVCMVSNSNTYGFLSGKAITLTMAFFALLSCGYWYHYRLASANELCWDLTTCISGSTATSEPSLASHYTYDHIYKQV